MVLMKSLGRSGLEIPRLVLGGNVFGFTLKGDGAFRVLDRFVDGGGTMIDTADVYSNWVSGNVGGESETLIGEWLKRRGRRDDVLIATKVGMLPGEGGEKLEPSRIAAAAEASLKRLGTDYIDLYYAHQDDERTPLEETLAAFDALVKTGKVRALGASNYSAERLRQALDISVREGFAGYQILQPEYNLIVRNRFEGALQHLCLEREIDVLPYFGLASGFLTGKYRSEADLKKSVRGGRMPAYMNARGFAVLEALDEIAAESGASQAQIALAWISAQPGIIAPIASATKVEQLDELLGAMELELSPDQIERLNEAGREE
ncbi:MAG: aldo/keto reductase [Sphingosinicella sp.]|nr:aldo/keto reductase [Sphingosinicella sp.]